MSYHPCPSFQMIRVILNSDIDPIHCNETTRVLNLSSHTLTAPQLSLLQKGLTFCPTAGEPDMGALASDLNNLRWAYYFKDTPNNKSPLEYKVSTNKTLQSNSRPIPPPAHRNLEVFILLNERSLAKQNLGEPRTKNLTLDKKAVIKELKGNKTLTIKEADKGGTVVILDTKDSLLGYVGYPHR